MIVSPRRKKKIGRDEKVLLLRKEGEVTKESKDEVKTDIQKQHFKVTRSRWSS